MERIIAQVVEIVKRKYVKDLANKDDLKGIEKAFKRVSEEITAKPRYDINKSYIDRIQTTIPDDYMYKRILGVETIN